MLKTIIKAVGLLACLAWFGVASAATMGSINVISALGHPLKAEISLGDLGRNDKATFVAKMASVNEFKGAGIDYPYSLPKIVFEVATRNNGEAYLKLTSTQPVNEPFVSLLVELSWPSGKLLREYTFLLDPVGFVPEQPKALDVKPVEPMVPVEEPVAGLPVPAAMPQAEAMPVEPTVVAQKEIAAATPVPESATEAAPVKAGMMQAEHVIAEPAKVEPVESLKMEPLAPSEAGGAAPVSIQVEKGDTLGKIVDDLKPVDVSLERMLVAMYRANAKQFDGKNMNRIRAGKILRMPEAGEIEKITQATAVKEIRAQVADWQDYRQKLAAAQSVTPEQEPKQKVAGKISAAVAEKAPVIKDSAKEVLRLSKGESLGDKAVVGNESKSKRELLTANADDATAKQKQLQEERKKIEKLESISKDASKLVELKAQPITPVEKPVADTKMPAEKENGLPPVQPLPAQQPVAEEADIMTTIMGYITPILDDPILLGAGVAVLLGLGGLGFVMARRGNGTQKKTPKKNEDVGAGTGSWRVPVAPSPDTGDFTQSVAAMPAASMNVAALDDVDPISEADLFLNFGRDVQAEEILKDALKKTPSNVQIRLKLLSIYANRKDSNTFSKYAQEVKDSGDTAAWERASIMGREVDPTNPVYGDAKGEARQREPAKAEVDFDLGLDKTGSPSAATQDFKMDFDLSGNQPAENLAKSVQNVKQPAINLTTKAKPSADVDATSILSRETVNAVQNKSPMDFDVSGILPGDVKNIAQSGSMDFDISGAVPEVEKRVEKSSIMDFDVTGGLSASNAGKKPAENIESDASTMNFNDLVFEIPTSAPKPTEKTTTPKVDADEGMAFTIDFPTGDNLETPSGKSASVSKLDIDFGEININLDDDVSPAHSDAEGKDEQWHEVATKLDLAKAYQEMGDADGAREILDEVVRDGDASQRESAEKLLQQISV